MLVEGFILGYLGTCVANGIINEGGFYRGSSAKGRMINKNAKEYSRNCRKGITFTKKDCEEFARNNRLKGV